MDGVHGKVHGLGPQKWSMDRGSMFCMRPKNRAGAYFSGKMNITRYETHSSCKTHINKGFFNPHSTQRKKCLFEQTFARFPITNPAWWTATKITSSCINTIRVVGGKTRTRHVSTLIFVCGNKSGEKKSYPSTQGNFLNSSIYFMYLFETQKKQEYGTQC